MTERELLMQALEALETCSEDEWHTEDDFGMVQVYDDKKVSEARAALRERLAQPEREWVGLTKEEAKEISMANRPYVVDMIAALEARLKEKNT